MPSHLNSESSTWPSNETQPKNRSRAKLAAEIGAAGLGVAGVAYAVLRTRKTLQDSKNIHLHRQYNEQANIFDNEKLKPEQKELMARAAVRIYVATTESEELVITRKTLLSQLDVTQRELQTALSRLSDHELIDRRPTLSNSHSQGYYATEALVWAVEAGDYEPIQEAVLELLREATDNL